MLFKQLFPFHIAVLSSFYAMNKITPCVEIKQFLSQTVQWLINRVKYTGLVWEHFYKILTFQFGKLYKIDCLVGTKTMHDLYKLVVRELLQNVICKARTSDTSFKSFRWQLVKTGTFYLNPGKMSPVRTLAYLIMQLCIIRL